MSKIKFYPVSHKYKYGRDELTSVTTFLKQFFPEFDAKGLARKIAKGFKYRNRQKELKGIEVDELTRQKQTMRYWLNDWKASAQHGTRVHNAIEEYINTGDALCVLETYCTEDRDINKFNVWLEWWKGGDSAPKNHVCVSQIAEEVIYDLELGLAGTIDYNAVMKDGTVYIMDWKTNTNFKRNYNGGNAFEPIEHMEDTKISKYQLQLSLYAYMLERKGAEIGDLILVEIGEEKIIEHKVEYLRKEIEELIKHGKKTN